MSAEAAPAVPIADASARGERLSPWVNALIVAIAVRIAFGIVAYAANWYLSSSTVGAPQKGFIDIWINWDAIRFIATAKYGYTAPGAPTFATAFFPLYPLLIRAVAGIGPSEEIAGLLISFLASVVALAYLFKLADLDVTEGAGGRAIVYLALFPTAVFLIAPYSESVFLAGAIPAFYFARTQRWALVGIPAAIAMGSRFAGVFLLAGLAVEFIRQRDWSRGRVLQAAGSCALAVLPLIGYAIYLARVKGDALYFFTDQREGWGRSLANPISAFANTVNRFDDPTQSTSFQFAYRVEILAAALGVAAVVWAVRKREYGYATYMGTAMLALMTSTEYFSIPRIMLTFFPVAIFLSGVTEERPGLHEVLVAGFASIAAFGVIVYTRGSWFF